MPKLEFAQLVSESSGKINVVYAVLPDGRREMRGAGWLGALNTLGAEGWDVVAELPPYESPPNAMTYSYHRYWLLRRTQSD